MSTLVDAVRAAVDAGLANTRVSLVATVEGYDAARGVVNVRPDVPRLGADGQPERWPVLYELPVQFAGSSSVVMSYEIPSGSKGLIVFHDLPLDGWKAGESEPRGRRSHALSDGVFVPGLAPSGDRSLASSGVELRVGVGPLDEVVRKADLQKAVNELWNEINALTSRINTHTHSGVATGPGTSGMPSTPIPSPAAVTAQASPHVKIS